MKLLVGLGNQGAKYVSTRHNLGFLIVDKFVKLNDGRFNRLEFDAVTSLLKVGDTEITIMKPDTGMNLSGRAVAYAIQRYKLDMKDVIVVHDEIDIPGLTWRKKVGGGSAGHNGLKSIIAHGDAFTRFRLGIGRPETGTSVLAHVMGKLTEEELKFWDKEADIVCAEIMKELINGK